MDLDVSVRKDLARWLLEGGTTPEDFDDAPPPSGRVGLAADLRLQFPAGLSPIPQPLPQRPSLHAELPPAEVLVITWTIDELNALADVLTPGASRDSWYRYRRHFDDRYAQKIRDDAPAKKANRLGSYFLTKIGQKRVLCFKSELHLNQDGISTGDGTATLPVKDLFLQLIAEVNPKLVITVGTSGATFVEHGLGDVVVTRAAKFRCGDEFKHESFNGKVFRSEWSIPTGLFDEAERSMQAFRERLAEPLHGPPTKRYPWTGPLLIAQENRAQIRLDGRDFDEFHPILTTDFYEFGTSANKLESQGCAVEMGDAVLGLACAELAQPPRWVVVRNISDPQINADLPNRPRKLDMQSMWAVWYYKNYGYETSVMSALTTWAIIAAE